MKTSRRTVMTTAGVAVAAAAAGVGLWQWKNGGSNALPPNFWSLSFDKPEGGLLQLEKFRGQPLVLNFWATWCAPCMRELPLLDRYARGSTRVKFLGLAVDSPTPVRAFLKREPLGYAVGLAGLTGTDLTRQLGNDAGGLPFSVLIGADGRIVQRQLGELSDEKLRQWIDAS